MPEPSPGMSTSSSDNTVSTEESDDDTDSPEEWDDEYESEHDSVVDIPMEDDVDAPYGFD